MLKRKLIIAGSLLLAGSAFASASMINRTDCQCQQPGFGSCNGSGIIDTSKEYDVYGVKDSQGTTDKLIPKGGKAAVPMTIFSFNGPTIGVKTVNETAPANTYSMQPISGTYYTITNSEFYSNPMPMIVKLLPSGC